MDEFEKDKFSCKKENSDYFYEVAILAQNERLKKERERLKSFDNIVIHTYAIFELFCKAFQKPINISVFKEYRRENKIGFWIAKRVTEIYFGCKYRFNNKTNKWVIEN